MTTCRLLSSAQRIKYFDIPSDTASLERYYVLATDDLNLIASRRRPENRLGLAIHIALLRHPGLGWYDGDDVPPDVVGWLCEQIQVSNFGLEIYGGRASTRATHRALAIQHLGLKPFSKAGFRIALEIATRVAFSTDDGSTIMKGLLAGLSEAKLVYPNKTTLERVGIAGRARARRLSAQALNDALNQEQQLSLQMLLIRDPLLGVSRLVWLRGMPHSTCVSSLHGLLERLTFVGQVQKML